MPKKVLFMKQNFTDDSIVNLLTNLLKITEIRKDACNSYYITTRANDISVKFLTGDPEFTNVDQFSVWLVNNEKGFKLSISLENKKKLLDMLYERVKNKQPKKINNDDFDNILSLLKEEYSNADVSQSESIRTYFAHELIYLFQAIPGQEKYIYGAWLSRLYEFIQQKYSENMKNAVAANARQRKK